MTGGEHALQLPEQLQGMCWVNRPLIPLESDNLIALTAVATHTPALQLMCSRIHAESESLRSLYPESSKMTPISTHMQWLEANLPLHASARHAYTQELQRRGCFPVQCSRRLLMPDEAQGLMAMNTRSTKRQFGQHYAVLPRIVGWANIQRLPSWRAFESVWSTELHQGMVEERLYRLVAEMTWDMPDATEAAQTESEQILSDLQMLGQTTHRSFVARQCVRSLKVYQGCSGEPRLRLHSHRKVETRLQQLKNEIELSQHHLTTFVLEALAFSPSRGKLGTALRVYQAAALAAKPALSDLIRSTLRMEHIHERFLFLCYYI